MVKNKKLIIFILIILITGCTCFEYESIDEKFCESKNLTFYYSDDNYIQCLDENGLYYKFDCYEIKKISV